MCITCCCEKLKFRFLVIDGNAIGTKKYENRIVDDTITNYRLAYAFIFSPRLNLNQRSTLLYFSKRTINVILESLSLSTPSVSRGIFEWQIIIL